MYLQDLSKSEQMTIDGGNGGIPAYPTSFADVFYGAGYLMGYVTAGVMSGFMWVGDRYSELKNGGDSDADGSGTSGGEE
ncbi:MAG: hypothetical protein R8G66_24030 [Cytophagales bacterium]|nr:hypothetical protein [Cytophagales bacterium]